MKPFKHSQRASQRAQLRGFNTDHKQAAGTDRVVDPYFGLPTLDMSYGLSRHMREAQTLRKWRPDDRVPTEAEVVREAAKYAALREAVAHEKANRRE